MEDDIKQAIAALKRLKAADEIYPETTISRRRSASNPCSVPANLRPYFRSNRGAHILSLNISLVPPTQLEYKQIRSSERLFSYPIFLYLAMLWQTLLPAGFRDV